MTPERQPLRRAARAGWAALGLGLALLQPPAYAEDPGSDPLSDYRVPFEELVDRTIGTTSKPMAFNWRRTQVQLSALGGHLFELNNFNSLRAGALVRVPSAGLIYEIGLTNVWVWDTPSSELLALTPYRQPGRPGRLELEFSLGVPLAEGVVTTRARFFPALQMVFMGYAGLRYSLYPVSFAGLKAGEVAQAVLAPALSDDEIENLDARRLDAMEVDRGRYTLLIGLGDDFYFKQGLFISPRVNVALPVLAPITETDLLLWGDFTLVIGVAL